MVGGLFIWGTVEEQGKEQGKEQGSFIYTALPG